MHAKIGPGEKKNQVGTVSALALETADLRDTLAKTEKHINRM